MDIDAGRLAVALFLTTIFAVFLSIGSSLLLAESEPRIIIFSEL